MEVCHIAAAVRKDNLLEKRQRLATGERPKKKPRILLSEEQKVAHAWVAACDAGDLRVVELLLPVVEHTALGVNCKDGAGLTGLMAALEKGRLEVVDRLLDHGDIDMDFTETDAKGRTALDLVILSPSNHFLDLILGGMEANLLKDEEMEKVVLPKLLSCVNLGKVKKFEKMLDFFDVNFKEGAVLNFLIVSGGAKFIKILVRYCMKTKEEIVITEQHRKSFLFALRTGRCNVVQPLFVNFFQFRKQLESILHIAPLPILGTARRVDAVKQEVFSLLKEMIQSRSFKPDIFRTGISCINVNARDDDGFTLLMLAVEARLPPAACLLLVQKSLDVNMTNNDDLSALDLLMCHWTYSCATDASYQLLVLFLERQATFKDVNFGIVKTPLLVKTLEENRLNLASSLLDCTSYHASPSELSTARGMLTLSKRLHQFYPKADSGDKKKMLLRLLHQVELRERHEGD